MKARPARTGARTAAAALTERDTATHLLDCALTLFAEKGYAATSVRDIIRAAGVTQPTLYYYCDNKADLFRRLVRQKFEDSHQQLEAVLREVSGCQARLRTLVRRSFEYCITDPRIPRLMFQTYFGPPVEGIGRFLEELTAVRFRLVVRLMQEGIASGELHSADPEFLALAFCCLMDQPVNLFARMTKPGEYLTPKLADAIVDLFLQGAGAQGTRDRRPAGTRGTPNRMTSRQRSMRTEK